MSISQEIPFQICGTYDHAVNICEDLIGAPCYIWSDHIFFFNSSRCSFPTKQLLCVILILEPHHDVHKLPVKSYRTYVESLEKYIRPAFVTQLNAVTEIRRIQHAVPTCRGSTESTTATIFFHSKLSCLVGLPLLTLC